MYKKQDLMNDLKRAGLKRTDRIMVHSSYKSIGDVEGRGETVIDAFMTYFEEGLFMMPAGTWRQMNSEYNVFDPAAEPGCVGILPELFRKRPGVVRSLHPLESILAYGLEAEAYVAGEENATTPCPPWGCWGRLKDIDAYILLLGVTHVNNTFIHSVAEILDIQDRLSPDPSHFIIYMPDGSRKEVDINRHRCSAVPTGISQLYDKFLEAFYELGAAQKVKFGDADCILCKAKRIYEVIAKILEYDKNCIVNQKEIPKEWWQSESR